MDCGVPNVQSVSCLLDKYIPHSQFQILGRLQSFSPGMSTQAPDVFLSLRASLHIKLLYICPVGDKEKCPCHPSRTIAMPLRRL